MKKKKGLKIRKLHTVCDDSKSWCLYLTKMQALNICQDNNQIGVNTLELKLDSFIFLLIFPNATCWVSKGKRKTIFLTTLLVFKHYKIGKYTVHCSFMAISKTDEKL